MKSVNLYFEQSYCNKQISENRASYNDIVMLDDPRYTITEIVHINVKQFRIVCLDMFAPPTNTGVFRSIFNIRTVAS